MTNSWFNEKTGTTDRERQSWRDSYNGGRAAGDITGNVNRQLNAERAAFQGATWSGSSSQPSALQLARAGGGASVGQVVSGRPGAGGVAGVPVSGPGVPVVANAPVVPTKGPARFRAAAMGFLAPWNSPSKNLNEDWVMPEGILFTPNPAEVNGRPFPMGNMPWEGNPNFPNGQEIEDEFGESELLSPGWFAQWGSAIGSGYWNAERALRYGVKQYQAMPKAETVKPEGGGAWGAVAATVNDMFFDMGEAAYGTYRRNGQVYRQGGF